MLNIYTKYIYLAYNMLYTLDLYILESILWFLGQILLLSIVILYTYPAFKNEFKLYLEIRTFKNL